MRIVAAAVSPGDMQGGAPPKLLVLRGSGGKAFCAGGDVKAVAQS